MFWLPGEDFLIGKDIFKDCSRLCRICRPDKRGPVEEQVGRLLGAVPVRLEAAYLFTPSQAGEEQWLLDFAWYLLLHLQTGNAYIYFSLYADGSR